MPAAAGNAFCEGENNKSIQFGTNLHKTEKNLLWGSDLTNVKDGNVGNQCISRDSFLSGICSRYLHIHMHLTIFVLEYSAFKYIKWTCRLFLKSFAL